MIAPISYSHAALSCTPFIGLGLSIRNLSEIYPAEISQKAKISRERVYYKYQMISALATIITAVAISKIAIPVLATRLLSYSAVVSGVIIYNACFNLLRITRQLKRM